ncbi:response regulator [Pseudomonas luteola]|uniref:Response regulator n=1 Tax=Pseudomonas luteola TaxID=47886 RepID=A0ABS0FS11_PSELU|nr:response regulator [Pseudomonas zeshuii]MBF8643099.1 response regulator [Pseudomonas zeshuii]
MMTVLVVDDELLVAEVLSYALEDEGYQVVRASNGQKALEALARETPALIISDFMMPIMNGLELAVSIKAHPATAKIPIILISGAQAHIAQQHSYLFERVLDKPFDICGLMNTVKTLIVAPQK